jgi:hypothetical protein
MAPAWRHELVRCVCGTVTKVIRNKRAVRNIHVNYDILWHLVGFSLWIILWCTVPRISNVSYMSVRMEQHGSHWADFYKIVCVSIFRKSVEKIKVPLKSDKNNRYVTFFKSYCTQFLLEWEMFQTKFVEKIKTHILWSVTFFIKSCRLWDNV